MTLSKSDMIGTGAAALAVGLVAWLSGEAWAISACRDILHTSAFDAGGKLVPDASPEAAAFAERAAAGNLTGPELACRARLGPAV